MEACTTYTSTYYCQLELLVRGGQQCLHHCSVRSSILYGEEDPPIHLPCLSLPSPLAVIVGQSLAVTKKKKEKKTLTINALARVRENERKFPELSAYYYYVLSATSGCSFCSGSSLPLFLSFHLCQHGLLFTAQPFEKGRQAFSELKPGHTQQRQGRCRRRQGWAVRKGAADKLTLVVLRSWRRTSPAHHFWWREERAWMGRKSLLTR